MAAKKEWQNAIEGVKKEVMDGMQEYFERMMSKLDEKEQNIKEAMKELVTKEVGELKNQIGEMNKNIQDNSEKIQELQTQTADMGKTIQDLTEENKRLEILLEAKTTERQLRLRGLEEEQNEDLPQKITGICSELLEQPPEDIQASLDLVYRVNSNFAKQNKIPRDVVIQLTTMRKKEEILKKHYETPLEVDNKKILVLKEIPRKALIRRKSYKKLIDFLIAKDIRYRWELPEGLSFSFKGRRQMIKTEDQMELFLTDQSQGERMQKSRQEKKNGE